MKDHRTEMKLYYNSTKMEDREVLAYAESLKHLVINEKDISRDIFTETQLKELANDMNTDLMGLIDKNDSLYMDKMQHDNYSEEELLKIMRKNPSVIKTPIAKVDKHVYHVKSHYELIPEDLDIKGIVNRKGNSSERSE
ncbi:MAG: ArsC/Spx/MgsR family protein [Cyclobacteriaceae bacterium]